MQFSNRITMLAGAVFLSLFCGAAQADGLTDLKTALTRLQGQAPLKAVLELKSSRRQGEGKDMEESSGHAAVSLEDSVRGLQVLYSKEMLSRAEQEARAKGKDRSSKTPTIMALAELGSAEMRPMVSAAAGLSRMLEDGAFKGEQASSYGGKPARLLSFEFSIEKLTERERKYIKKMESNLEIWIAPDGTPLASRFRQSGSGRAFVVVSFEQTTEEESVYSLAGDRLLTVRRESKFSSSGAGEKMESKVVKTLQLQS